MLICLNPSDKDEDQIWINPDQVVDVRPLRQKRSTKDPGKTVWVFSVARSDGQSSTTEYASYEAGRPIQDQFFGYHKVSRAPAVRGVVS